MFDSIFTSMNVIDMLICSGVSIICGLFIGYVYMFKNVYHKGFVVSVVLMPVIVQVVIMMVNGNLGTGVAVVGAFSLVRFRSVAGGAREISTIFLSMAIGLATGMGYVMFAIVFALLIGITSMILYGSSFAEANVMEKELKITIPESLDYEGIFDDIFQQYTTKKRIVEGENDQYGKFIRITLSYLFTKRYCGKRND